MTQQRSEFRVIIYEGEYQQLCQWTLMMKNIETGGDLFGLWHDYEKPVVQLVLGPGKSVRRSGASFYQDVQYLEDVGSILTGKEGLCHIGEWHSHHQLGLARPSGGDISTVWTNMPRYGLTKFFICISNISFDRRGNEKVSVGCFLFEFDPVTRKKLPVLDGEFEIVPENSPIRVNLQEPISKGAETTNKTMTAKQRNNYLKKVQRDKDKYIDTEYDSSEGSDDHDHGYSCLWYMWQKIALACHIVCTRLRKYWNTLMAYIITG